jgi:CxxC motif-containing protein (DUF1111 family)/cytochrome c553
MDQRIALARRMAFLGLTGSALWLTGVAVTGCSSVESVPAGTGPAGSGGPTSTATGGTGGATTTTTPGGAATTTTGGMAVTGTPPSNGTCGGVLPASYNAICNTCHTQAGTANARYPDLYQFKGTLAEFTDHVRKGSPKGMAAYPAELISDADVGAIFNYFSGGTVRPTAETVDLGGVVPLYNPASVVNPPIVFKRDDGVLITRGAGRVRGRHEGPLDTNQPFMEFVADYFLSRTYGFIVEDYTPLGQSKITVTYLPISMPTGGTNFRAWKQYGNGDVFSTNAGMTSDVTMPPLLMAGKDMAADYKTTFAPYARLQQQTTTTNTRDGGPIMPGMLFEFEFGIFNDGGAIQPPGSRTNYYTDTFRYQVGKGGVTSNNPDKYTGGMGILGPEREAQQGGDTTNVWPYYMKETQFGQMALNVQHENVQHLVEGRRLFHTDFTAGTHSEPNNPVFMEQMGKAGPLGTSTSCENCHNGNGPGELLKAPLDAKSSMAIKLYDAGDLGAQLQLKDGSATAAAGETKMVALGDGTSVTLTKPAITVTLKAGGAAPKFSARIARKVIGMGLLEAIDEKTILARVDQKDCNTDGISGRANFIKDPATGDLRVGRFGWKAEKVDVRHQIAEAALDDMGVGTSLFPDAGKTELADDDLNRLVTYMRLVSVPGQRNHSDPKVLAGEQVFKTVGCANCHVTDVVTGANHPFVELRSQDIKPYTDLLLHDMGDDLADNSGVALSEDVAAPAAASEWRTPPLWGTGLLGTISMHTNLLHDGRAANVLEAILWHGGEALATRDRVTKLSATDREALLAFVSSL